MGSSESTPGRSTRSKRPIRRLVLVIGDDHPKACTGRRLLRRGLAETPSPFARHARPIVLDPFAPEPLSAQDRPYAEAHGLLVVDGSWNRLSARGRLDVPLAGGHVPHRRLPMLIATNPQHFGHLAELNSVEALAAALSVLGRANEASDLLEGFSGGTAFLAMNRERLEAYRRAVGPDGVRDAERRLFGVPDDLTRWAAR